MLVLKGSDIRSRSKEASNLSFYFSPFGQMQVVSEPDGSFSITVGRDATLRRMKNIDSALRAGLAHFYPFDIPVFDRRFRFYGEDWIADTGSHAVSFRGHVYNVSTIVKITSDSDINLTEITRFICSRLENYGSGLLFPSIDTVCRFDSLDQLCYGKLLAHQAPRYLAFYYRQHHTPEQVFRL